MAEYEIHEDHGHSVAAWTAVVIILVGAAVASLAVVLASVPLFVVGIVICALGALVGKLLGMAGYGAKTVSGGDTPESNKPEMGVK